jgi:hypothetical protein
MTAGWFSTSRRTARRRSRPSGLPETWCVFISVDSRAHGDRSAPSCKVFATCGRHLSSTVSHTAAECKAISRVRSRLMQVLENPDGRLKINGFSERTGMCATASEPKRPAGTPVRSTLVPHEMGHLT